MGVEGPKEKEKGGKVICKEFFFLVVVFEKKKFLKKTKKVQLHQIDFRDIKRRRMAMNEEVAGVEDGMERREEEGWVGVIWLGGRKGRKSGEVVGKDKT